MKNLSASSLSPLDTAPPFNTTTDGSLQAGRGLNVMCVYAEPEPSDDDVRSDSDSLC